MSGFPRRCSEDDRITYVLLAESAVEGEWFYVGSIGRHALAGRRIKHRASSSEWSKTANRLDIRWRLAATFNDTTSDFEASLIAALKHKTPDQVDLAAFVRAASVKTRIY